MTGADLQMGPETDWLATAGGFTDTPGGIWRSHLPASAALPPTRPALFLDRDGVVVEEVDYLARPEDVRLTEGAGAAIADARAAGYLVVLITNQSGIARQYFDWPVFEAVQSEISRQLALSGAAIDAVYACGYHETGAGPLAVKSHAWRKPSPGMVLCGISDLGIDPRQSYLVGDRASDLAAGRGAGLAAGVLVGTGYGASDAERDAAGALRTEHYGVEFAPNLHNAWRSIRSLARLP